MKFLFDSHFLIWIGYFPDRLPPRARTIIASDDTVILFSAASLWEMTIKQALGKPDFDVDVAGLRAGLRANNYQEIELTGDHAIAVADLRPVHRDPFDRLLIAQAKVEEAIFLTADARLADYGQWVMTV